MSWSPHLWLLVLGLDVLVLTDLLHLLAGKATTNFVRLSVSFVN